jgi:SAM-dependent methyltransferase
VLGLFILVALVVVCFSFVLLRGAPYLPTLTSQVDIALDLVALKPGQTLLELGCGDGKVLIAAAERGWNVVGYELNPLMALVAWLRTRRYRYARNGKGSVRVVCADFWTKQWPPHDGIFVFLLDSFMEKLNNRIVQETGKNGKSVKLVSFAFQIPDREPKVERSGLFLYEYK